MPVVCTSQIVDHADACADEPCTITEDIEVFCDDGKFAGTGLHVAPAPDATWLATTSASDRMVFRIEDGNAVRVDEGLPAAYASQKLGFALDKGGAPHLAVDGKYPPPGTVEPARFEHALWTGFEWTISEVCDHQNTWGSLSNMDIGADNTSRIWIGKLDNVLIASPGQTEGWDMVPVSTPLGGAGLPRYTIATTDKNVAFDFVSAGGSELQLRASIDGVENSVGDPISFYEHYSYAVAHAVAPAGAPTAGPTFAAAIQHWDSLRVAWPDASSYAEIALPSSNVPVPVCDGMWDNGCPPPCHETASGVELDAYAIARTADGSIWVAFVRTQYDWQVQFEEECFEIGCLCQSFIVQDDTTATLHLFRIATALGTATEALTVATRPLQGYEKEISFTSPVHLLDLRGFGTELAIGLRTVTDVKYKAAARVMRVDTTLLP